METIDRNSGLSAHGVLPSPTRLLVFAVLLPAIVAGTNQLLLDKFPSAWLQTWFYPSLVLSTAVLSWCAGRYLYPAWLRWILFAWCLALLDVLIGLACLTGDLPNQFGYVLVSAQMSLLILWAVLGSGSWQWRVPAAGALLPFVFVFADSFARSSYVPEQSWNFMMLIAAPIIALLCGGLRYFGFVLTEAPLEDRHELRPGKRRTYQFSMKHMLIWFTVSGPLLLFVRGIDFGGRGMFPAALLAVSVATVNLIAIWAVLGAGYWIIRVASLLAIPFLIALGMSHYSAYLKSTSTGLWYQHYGTIAWVIGEMEDHWIAWLWLDAALLAALLLFIRASGHRLDAAPTRHERCASTRSRLRVSIPNFWPPARSKTLVEIGRALC